MASSQTGPHVGQRPTRAQCVKSAGAVLALAYDELYDPTVSVAENARRAYTPTGPSVAELERRIAARRGLVDVAAVA